MNIGKNIVNLRKKNKMTQQDLADSLGISRSAICRIESKPSIDVDLLEKISKVFKVPLINLIYEDEAHINYEIAASKIFSKAPLVEIYSNNSAAYRKLPDRTKNFIRAMGIEIYEEILYFQDKAIEKFSRNLQSDIQYLFDEEMDTIKKSCLQFIDAYTATWLENTLKERR